MLKNGTSILSPHRLDIFYIDIYFSEIEEANTDPREAPVNKVYNVGS